MKITYTSPNRPIHYHYARAFQEAGILHRFISGFPRISKKAPLPELGDKLVRRDSLQLAYLASLRASWTPLWLRDGLATASKRHLDRSSLQYATESDWFLFYNSCGLKTMQTLRNGSTRCIVEVVNSHVLNQEAILIEEHKRMGIPYKGIHGPDKKRRLQEYELADYILCPSDFVRRSFLERDFDPARLIKNPFGFESPGQSPVEKPASETFKILYVGQISVRKGVRYLIEAFEQFKHPRKELTIVGGQTPASGIEKITLPEGVRFTGILKWEDLARAYSEADVFVLAAVEEGLALVMGEALSFGLPIIATENTGVDDLITDGKEGFIVPIRDPKAIAEKLTLLADTPDLLQRMSAAAKQKADSLEGWSQSGANLVQSLRNLHSVPGKV